MLKKLLSFLAICFILITGSLFAQQNENPFLNKYISNYTENEYGKEFNAQNWSVTQDAQGLLYFGNSYSVLTFDGVHWNSIPVSHKSGYVFSLLAAESGEVYWGYDGDFGVIERAENGAHISRSLLENIPEMDRYFLRIWKIYKYQNRIVFFAQESIFIYNPESGEVEVIYPEESFHLAFVAQDQLYVRDRAFGLMKFDGKKFQKVAGGDIFHNEGIFGIIPIDDDRLMIITQLIGLYTYDGDGIKALESSDTEMLNQQQIIGSLKLQNGNIALNTASNGVIVINRKGEVQHQISQASGIADNDVKQVYQDDYQNLWIVTHNGISWVNYSSPISLFLHNDKSGLFGSVKTMAKTNSHLFVGTTAGLFIYAPNESHVFEKVKALSNNITALYAVGDELFIGTSDAAYLLRGNQLRKLASTNVSSFLYSEANTRMYVIGENGMTVFQAYSDWEALYENKDIALSCVGSILITDEQQVDQLWLGTINRGLFHFKIPRNFGQGIEKLIFDTEDDLPEGSVMPFNYNGELIVGTSDGLYQLEEINVEDSESDSIVNYKPYFVSANIPSLDSGFVTLFESAQISHYLVYNGVVGQLINGQTLYQTPFMSLDIGKINCLLAESDSMIWIGANGGLAGVDLSQSMDYKRKPDIQIGRLAFSNDSVFCYLPKPNSSHRISYDQNSFQIQFSSRYNENGKNALFSYKLDGYDETWSLWSNVSEAPYKKMSAGKYLFRVRALDIYGVQSEEVSINIAVLAPWYQSWWAYILYLILLLLLLIGVVKTYTYRLKQKNIQLEEVITERTKEIRQQKDEIEDQRDLIKVVHEEIQSSIAYAQRIQTAILPQHEFDQAIIKDYFVLFKPKDVVSGDFYWAKKNGDNLIFAVADCTGHGVPGAFMSMLGISLLNEIVGRESQMDAGVILNQLRDGVIHALRQDMDSTDVKDGMDISLVVLNMKSGELNWSGAYNPLFVTSKSEPEFSVGCEVKIHESKNSNYRLFDIKPNKMPIAIGSRMQPFASHQVRLQSGDAIYLFSDGYIDQFGGPKGKKMMIKAFRNMLLDNTDKDLASQKLAYEKNLIDWQAYNDPNTGKSFSQIDDICLMGIRF